MGAMHAGEKYAPMWAAVACRAGFGSPARKGRMEDTPLYFTVGSNDSLGSRGRALAEHPEAEGMNAEWKEMPGLGLGGIIADAMPDVCRLFNEHSRPEAKN